MIIPHVCFILKTGKTGHNFACSRPSAMPAIHELFVCLLVLDACLVLAESAFHQIVILK